MIGLCMNIVGWIKSKFPEWLSDTTVEIFFALMVTIGYILTIGLNLYVNNDFGKSSNLKDNTYVLWIAGSIAVGAITFVFRRLLPKGPREVPDNPNRGTPADLSILFMIAVITALPALSFMYLPEAYITYTITAIAIPLTVCLNSYFTHLWNSDDSEKTIKELELEHSHWSTIHTSIVIGLLLFIGGVVIGREDMIKLGLATLPPEVLVANVVIIGYITLGYPLIWLLRPINNTMARIRHSISIKEMLNPATAIGSDNTVIRK